MAAASPSVAGIVSATNDASKRVIPTSVRADGSVRKERAIKPGYVPVEDVARFKPGQGRLRDQLAAAQARFEAPASPSPAGNAATLVTRIKSPADFVARDRPVYPKFEKRVALSHPSPPDAPFTPSSKQPVNQTMSMTSVEAALPSVATSAAALAISHKQTSSFSSGASRSRWASAPAETVATAFSTHAPSTPAAPVLPPPRPASPARSTASTRSVSSARGGKSAKNQEKQQQPQRDKHKTPPHSPPQNSRRTLQSDSTNAMSMDELTTLMHRLGPLPVQHKPASSTPTLATMSSAATVSTPVEVAVAKKSNKRGDRPPRRGRARDAAISAEAESSGSNIRQRQPIAALNTAIENLPGNDNNQQTDDRRATNSTQAQESPSIALPDLSGAGDWWSDSEEEEPHMPTSMGTVEEPLLEIVPQDPPASVQQQQPVTNLNDSGFVPKQGQKIKESARQNPSLLPAAQMHERHTVAPKASALQSMTLSDICSRTQYLAYNLASLRFTSSRFTDEESEQANSMQSELAELRDIVHAAYVDVEQAWSDATAPVDDEEL